jgi:hypothetical protein
MSPKSWLMRMTAYTIEACSEIISSRDQPAWSCVSDQTLGETPQPPVAYVKARRLRQNYANPTRFFFFGCAS